MSCTVRGSNLGKSKRFSLLQTFNIESAADPAYYSARTLGRDDDRSPLSSAEVKNEWSYTSTPHIHAFMV